MDLLAGTVAVSASDGKGFIVSEQKPDQVLLVGLGSVQGHAWTPFVHARSLRGSLRLSLLRCELLQRGSSPEVYAAARSLATSTDTLAMLRRGTAVASVGSAAGRAATHEAGAMDHEIKVLLASLPGRGAQPGPEMGDIQCVEPASGGYGALYISGGAPV